MARIIVDMDDTLVQLVKYWLARYNKDHGDSLTIDNIKSWDIESYTKIPWDELKKYLFEPGFFLNLPPMPNGIETVSSWHEQGHEIIIATMPVDFNLNIMEGKVMWLKRYLPWFEEKNLFLTHRKYLIEADAMIDDNLEFLRKFKGLRMKFRRPWNDPSVPGFHHYAVSNWYGADKIVQEHFPVKKG